MNQEFIITRNNEQITLTDEELKKAEQFILASKGRERLEDLINYLENEEDEETLWDDYGVSCNVGEIKKAINTAIERPEICSQLEVNLLDRVETELMTDIVAFTCEEVIDLMEGNE